MSKLLLLIFLSQYAEYPEQVRYAITCNNCYRHFKWPPWGYGTDPSIKFHLLSMVGAYPLSCMT